MRKKHVFRYAHQNSRYLTRMDYLIISCSEILNLTAGSAV